ncbi:MAG: hypothetical protein AB7O66_09705, partial [Limisphaerales bacterium]
AVLIDSSYLFGKATPGSPSSLEREAQRLDHFINLHNGDPSTAPDGNTYVSVAGANVPTTDLPEADGTSTGQIQGGWISASIDVTGWEYLMVKWANNAFYYFVGDLTGVHTLLNDVQFNKKGVAQEASHYRLFGGTEPLIVPFDRGDPGTPVPDTGMTLALMGVALVGLTLLRPRARTSG